MIIAFNVPEGASIDSSSSTPLDGIMASGCSIVSGTPTFRVDGVAIIATVKHADSDCVPGTWIPGGHSRFGGK
jgi:hypothetical protein